MTFVSLIYGRFQVQLDKVVFSFLSEIHLFADKKKAKEDVALRTLKNKCYISYLICYS